jgi:hypothetical protein
MPGIYNMKKLNVQEKSRGVVLFAVNTDTVDYVKIANQAARLIQHTLNLPTTVITDTGVNSATNFRTGFAGATQWKNGGRYRAYDLSPYEETILIDSDYLQLDTSLLKILDTTYDYRLMHTNQSPAQLMTDAMGPLSLTYVWATAITFRRTEKAKALFDLVGRIERNYAYYQKLYHITSYNFRNDYAFAIANNILSGYTTNLSQSIPFTMLTLDKLVKNIEITGETMLIREENCAHVVAKQNIHIMDKDYLLSTNFNKLVDDICG